MLFIVVVAIERAHEPVIFEKSLPLVLLVDVLEHHLPLQKHLMFLYCPPYGCYIVITI